MNDVHKSKFVHEKIQSKNSFVIVNIKVVIFTALMLPLYKWYHYINGYINEL